MIKDVMLKDDDLCFGQGTGDFLYVKGIDAIKQQREQELKLFLGDDISEPTKGSKISKFVNSEDDDLTTLAYKRELKRIIKKDDNIKSDSVSINISDTTTVSFETVEGVNTEMKLEG